MHQELRALFEQDQRDRPQSVGPITLILTPLMRFRDWRRRRRVQELIAAGALSAPEDFYHAAMILQHGTQLADSWQAHELAKRAADLGYRPARWLAAAALDRFLMRQGRPQKYGTQYTTIGKWWQFWRFDRTYRLWDVDPATTDEERQEWGVPPLAVAQAYAEALGTEAEKQIPSRTIATATIASRRVEVRDLRWVWAQAPQREPAAAPLEPDDAPEASYVPEGCALCRVGDEFGIVDGDGRVVALWRRWSVPPDKPFDVGWRWAGAPTIEETECAGRAVIWIGGDDDGSSQALVGCGDGVVWYVWGRLPRDELVRVAAGLSAVSTTA